MSRIKPVDSHSMLVAASGGGLLLGSVGLTGALLGVLLGIGFGYWVGRQTN